VFGPGWACFLLWGLAGILLALTVIGIPFAYAAFRIAGFSAFPFGRRLVAVGIRTRQIDLFNEAVAGDDHDFAGNDSIAFNAGTHRELLQLAWHDYQRLVEPVIMHLTLDDAAVSAES